MFDFGFGPYSNMRVEFPMVQKPSRITGVGRAKGRGPDKEPRYALQKARKHTKMKKASRRRNRK